ncbi:hypothetical protein FHR99_002668 [Litorivivens lipolytica]|uniref:YecA family protein n=1 Tax=Litorivivens lipolytica TaxID=1524264 RepID=A0A7W4Z6D0_9GAMM|nr:UPF0149 family protein [Litorivivens lipolytica]MBB3048394.1 hypothetical protein [Litorivivens lipolytica]
MATALPDHDDIADLFVRLGALYPPAELHGFFVGQVVVGERIDEKQLREQAAQLLDVDSFGDADWPHLLRLYQVAVEQLGGDIGAMTLFLPGDDVDLDQRVSAVGSWCQGFLTGFAMAGKQREKNEGAQQYSTTVSEVLTDIAAISQAGLDTEQSEEAERQFSELVSYLEMAVVSVFVECCSQARRAGEHPAPKQVH